MSDESPIDTSTVDQRIKERDKIFSQIDDANTVIINYKKKIVRLQFELGYVLDLKIKLNNRLNELGEKNNDL